MCEGGITALYVFAPRRGEKKGTHRGSVGEDEGHPCYLREHPLAPPLSQRLRRRSPFLSPLARGEDMYGVCSHD